MRHLIVAILAAVFASMSPTSSRAATIIDSGAFGADELYSISGSYSVGPGKYRFQLDLSTPVAAVFGDVFKTLTYNFYCDFQDGSGIVNCGGNDVPTGPPFTQLTPTSYIADLTVNPPYSIPLSPLPFVREDGFESCCTYAADIFTIAAGTYTLSVSAVPEPAAWMLMILGIGITGAAMRRRRPGLATAL
jgi:PEP-CTERM motif